VTFVVEHRTVAQDGAETGGATVRALGADDGHEYARLDMFHASPHYHRAPGEPERVLCSTPTPLATRSRGIARLRTVSHRCL
jgi:hypothetical protein